MGRYCARTFCAWLPTHVLLLTLHHIVFDDWSHGVLVRELLAFYAAFRAGQPAPLSPLPIQYGDYAAWQRQRVATGQFDDQLAFWTAHLRDAPVLLDLPTDYPRPSIASAHGASYLFTLPATLRVDHIALSRQSGTTLFMTLLAVFSVLMARLSGQIDLLIGTPIAGRTQAEVEGLIGLFANVLALRIRLEGNPPVCELLQRVRSVTLAAYDHQAVPFEQVLQALALTRDPSRHPLFQVQLVVQTAPLPTFQAAGVEVKQLEVRQSGAGYDLTLFFREEQGGLRGRLEYRTDLFEEATIARLVGQFQLLLAGIVADSEQRIAALPLLSAADRTQILETWNATDALFPADGLVHELIAAQAARTPDAVACVDSSTSLTYAELHARAQELAQRLQSRQIGPEAIAGICMERSLNLVIAALAVMYAGGIYLLIDPDAPAERRVGMLEDARATVLISSSIRDGRLTISDLRHADNRSVNPKSRIQNPDSLAYVIYTSGSTGRPKGVAVPHGGLLNLVGWHLRVWGRADRSRDSDRGGWLRRRDLGELAVPCRWREPVHPR